MSNRSFALSCKSVQTALVMLLLGISGCSSEAPGRPEGRATLTTSDPKVVTSGSQQQDSSNRPGTSEVPVKFSGGHEIGAGDFGRPIALIAAGLGVEPDVFREAFSGVTPAHGRGPTGDEARKNKSALMKVLGPHGVSNERLDEVSNYYRFRPQNGERWPTREAQASATISDGKITGITVTDPGSGYCSIPETTVPGFESVKLKVTLGYSKDLKQNGNVASVEVTSKAEKK